MEIQGPNRGPKEAKMHRLRNQIDREDQWPPRSVGCASPGLCGFLPFRATFRFPAVFALFCPYNTHVPGLIEDPNTPPLHSIFNLVLD